MTDIRLAGGNPADVADALMCGKPASSKLQRVYDRVLREHLADLVATHLPAHDLHRPQK